MALAQHKGKENLPPNLQDLLKSNGSSDAIQSQRRYFLDAIQSYAGSDPLKPWVACVKWAKSIITSSSAPGVRGELCPLLEFCTKAFLDDPRYREDLRYLRIWLRYADCCADPLHIFELLEAKRIGQTHSLFYEAYAMILELRGDITKANQIYELGISRHAQPVEQLEKMHASFLKRKFKTSRPSEVKGSSVAAVNPMSNIARPHGDETIAIKKYAEEAIVLGVDPEAANAETHIGLVEPTINTREALVNVLSLFNQPLPLDQVKQPKAPSSQRRELPGAMELNVFVDEAPSEQAKKPQGQDKPSLGAGKMDFNIFVDDAFCDDRRDRKSEFVDPWDETLVADLLKKLAPPLQTYKGFHCSSKKYSGGVSLSSLKANARNKTVELGNSTYFLKGCTGQGAFAQVYQAHENSNNESPVVLKIQKPPCPWEFYIYYQLDKRIPVEERDSFGSARKMYVFSDCSILVAGYGQHGTLQDVVNAYLAHSLKMDELLCMYYTIEMLRMLEVLHGVGIIHADFKPDNLLIRNDSDNWENWAPNRPGCWKGQGLCLIDWGRSIDMRLFPEGTEFFADSKTSAFRCIEMVEERPWTYQVDGYGLCCIVHCMLHGSYMELEEERSPDGGRVHKPKASLKRYWNTNVWDKFFKTLLNASPPLPLSSLREMLEQTIVSNAAHPRRLKELLIKQTVMMYPRR
ncbi:mitotic checkpoint serine/threonine-protein kinase BUB1 [Selaginella moellendorffii]|uniref:mitotic checkpoint serine/threonine-protein kinase BUB1 n=1 Tax=Selaginella moellendorffii TaxID=88036 RepID=UPI000D1C9392|nr:mitotic checkpoint serine/threonine-protein kinase BUB1 [Selaginella moellendorffii]|eukprot:XP_024521383.1 mitotic checkpoint serine/threonine-protein kinase BUB1 [Selaginella moellendorffii]